MNKLVTLIGVVVAVGAAAIFSNAEEEERKSEIATFESVQQNKDYRVSLLGVTKGIAFVDSQELIGDGGRPPGKNAVPWMRVATVIEELTDNDETWGFIAETADGVSGHIVFSPVRIGAADALCFGLGPMAVDPAHQRTGIGSALVPEGLSRCRELGAVGVLVLGHRGYYPRFGFRPASEFGICSDYDVPDEVFMALELVDGGLAGIEGVAHYHPAFAAV